MPSKLLLQFLFYLSFVDTADAFAVRPSLASTSLLQNHDSHRRQRKSPFEQRIVAAGEDRSMAAATTSRSRTRCYNFLKDAFENAFSNDRNLSADQTKGQYDDIFTGEEYIETESLAGFDDGLTETQRKWRQSQASEVNVRTVNYDTVVGKSLTMDLYLSGVPERDPSNDLYGSKVNISNRDKATGLSLPSSPSVNIKLDFLEDGVCRASESGFTSGESNGEWKVSEDGKVLRFSIDSLGYTRTVQTKGSIQNVYWTDEEEKSIQTSTTYSIPPGMVYGDVSVTPGRIPGTFEVEKEGALRIEKSTGLFGIASQMVACGKFVTSIYKETTPVGTGN